MSTKDSLTKLFLSQEDVFADAFNYLLFGGEAVIKPEDLTEQDPTEIAEIRKLGKIFTDQKYRDVLKLCTIRRNKYATLVLLGIESQSNIHYAMPVRDMLYDALNYHAQVEAARRRHEGDHDLSGAELLSGFSREDRLVPVITLCICFEPEKWDAPRSLHDMFGKIDPRVRKYVNDYRLNLITPDEIEDFNMFASELGILLEFINNANDKEGIRGIIKRRAKEFSDVSITTIDMINTYTSANFPTDNAEGGKVDMCKGWQDLLEEEHDEGRAEGRVEGRAEGRAEGRVESIRNIMKNLKMTAEQAMKALGIEESEQDKYLAML
ncbi:MAG: transposase [Lachnospiraceae bacterium]|nr:transposase [Lachnospiraceae bacterium]